VKLRDFALVTFVLAAPACGSHAETSPPAADSAPKKESDGAIVVDEKMLASIKVQAIGEGDSVRALTIAGKVQFDEDRVARVLAPLSGQVVGLHVKVGDTVRRGETLCALSSREAAAAAGEHIESKKDLELAEKNAAMTQDLFEHEAASRIALQQSQNDLAKARARVARTEEALRVLGVAAPDDLSRFNGKVPLTSPIAGVVVERKVTEGQFVQSDSTPLITVANLDAVWVVGDVFERDLRLVGRNQPATISTTAYPGEQYEGRINYISDAIDPATHTAKVRVSVGNRHGRLKPEMYATVTLSVGERERVLSVPADAIFTEGGRSYVFVEAGRGRFVRRAIEVDPGEGARRHVASGLSAGDRVVVDGALLLRQEEQQRAS
jgi:cobalt-zinc-cadmium efflux system membrane fusion protein